MALKVITQNIEVEYLAGEESCQLPVRAEALVPGAGREAVEVLMADGYAVVTASEAQTDRAVISGMVYCQAAYRMGEEGGVRALTAQAPFEQIVEIEGATAGMSVRADAQIEQVEAGYESGHMIFRAAVALRVRLCGMEQVEAVSAVEGVEGIQTRSAQICSAKLNAENASTVELAEEVRLPAAMNARSALMQWAEPVVARTERDLGGIRVSGEVRVEALVASGVSSRPVALVRCTLPFEQLISLPDWIQGEPEAQAEVSRLALEVAEGAEEEDSILSIHCDLLLTVRMNGVECAALLTDLYATGGVDLEGEDRELELCTGIRRCAGQESFRGALSLPEGAAPVGTVLAVRAHPVVSSWRPSGGRSVVEGVMEVTVLYMAPGGESLSSTRGELPFSIPMDCELGEDAWVWVNAAEAEAAALMSDRLEVKCALRAASAERIIEKEEVLVGVREEAAKRLPAGVGVYYPQAGDSLWSVARRYRIPEEALRQANAGVQQAEGGRPLLILRGNEKGYA